MAISPGPSLCRAAPGSAGDPPVVSFALCRDCGADIAAWRERLLPIRMGALAVSERGALVLQVERAGVCDRCGGGRAEIRVEARGGIVCLP